MITVGEIATVATVTQIVVRLGERAAREIEKPRKLRRPEPAEPLGNVPSR
jgi:hypothetical protein